MGLLQCTDLEDDVRHAVEDDDARIADLHLWTVGPGIHAAIVSVVAHEPAPVCVYKQRIQARCPSLVHVTVELQRCPSDAMEDSKDRWAVNNPLPANSI